MIFGVLNPEKIWHYQLVPLPTLPVYCSHFTLRNPKKSYFSTVLFIHTSDYLRYLRRKQTATVVLQLICLLSVVYCFLLSA